MAEQLYTIPINEAFDEFDGCPLCRLRNKLEEQSLNYIMGAAMMEPDIRITTNRLGFCHGHFQRMLTMGNRLSLALMLESHLKSVAQLVPDPEEKQPGKLGRLKKYDGDTPAPQLKALVDSCYVCQRSQEFEKKYVSNIIYIYKKDPTFRDKLKKQPYFCLEHTAALLEGGKAELKETMYLQFSQDLMELAHKQVQRLHQNIGQFCRSFDHRYANDPLTPEARQSVEDSIAFLSGD